jgi:hypothetical protein
MKLPRIKFSQQTKQIMIILFVLGVLLCIPPIVKAVVNAVGGVLGWTEDKIDAVVEGAPVLGKAIIVGLVAYAVLGAGVAMLAAPVAAVVIVGAVLVIGAIAALGWCGYSVGKVFGFWGSDEEDLPKGQKPDGVKLNGPM